MLCSRSVVRCGDVHNALVLRSTHIMFKEKTLRLTAVVVVLPFLHFAWLESESAFLRRCLCLLMYGRGDVLCRSCLCFAASCPIWLGICCSFSSCKLARVCQGSGSVLALRRSGAHGALSIAPLILRIMLKKHIDKENVHTHEPKCIEHGGCVFLQTNLSANFKKPLCAQHKDTKSMTCS